MNITKVVAANGVKEIEHMNAPCIAAWTISAAIIFTLTMNQACSQSYPSKPVRIVTAEAGGGNDFTARLIGQGLGPRLGVQVVTENRGGASGAIAAQTVAKSSPDGYTLLLYSSAMWTLPFVQKVAYDPVRDFAGITLAASSPNILVVHPALPVRSVRDLIALAKARPGALNYATGATASTGHLAAELFKSMANVNIVRIPYKGNGPALNDLIAGQVQMTFGTAASVAPHVKSGRVRALAVTSAHRSALLPELPPIASALPGYESTTAYGVFAPAGTAPPIIKQLNQEIVRTLENAETKERFFASGAEPVGNSPEEFTAGMKSEMARLGKVIKGAGIHDD